MSPREPNRHHSRSFEFDELPKKRPLRDQTLNDIPSSALRRATNVIRKSGRQQPIPATRPAPKTPPKTPSDTPDASHSQTPPAVRKESKIEIRNQHAPKPPSKKGPPPRVIVITSVPLRQRIAQSFFRKILNLPELVIEIASSIDEMLAINNPTEFKYALIDSETPAWETIRMFLQKRSPECRIKISRNFVVDFKNFSG